jgi:hypothetical protein
MNRFVKGTATTLMTLWVAAAALIVPAHLVSSATANFADGPPRWGFNPPRADDTLNHDYTEVATYTLELGKPHLFCWSNSNVWDDGSEDIALQFVYRRYRVEGGLPSADTALPYDRWVAVKDGNGNVIPTQYCATASSPPRAGHWVYEARMCRVPYDTEESCSEWASGVVPSGTDNGGGTVDERPKGWWIYAYLGKPDLK